jgi:aminopeptidase N
MHKYFYAFLLITTGLFAQIHKNYDLLDLDARIHIFPYKKMLNGNLTYKLKIIRNTDSIIFDAPDIHSLKVLIKKRKLKFIQTDKYLIIKSKFKKDKIYNIKISYTAQPKKAMYFTGWQSGGEQQVWTQGQGKNNSHWLPVNDDMNDKFTWTFHIEFPEGYRVVSNGNFIEKKYTEKQTQIFTYKQNQPAPAYLIFIGAGKYDETKTLSESGIPIFNYQYHDKLQNDKTYYKSKEIFDFLEQEIGVKYPWNNYKQIPCRDFLYGGMENVSATSFNGDRYIVDSIGFNDTNFMNVSAHELTHQWFGDLVTGASSGDHWLHEGFATYYARLSDAQFFGNDYNAYNSYQYDKQIIENQYIDTIPIHRPNASSLTYYQKGARVVEMLRHKIGNDNFKKIIRNFLQKYAFRNANIRDFQKCIYKVTGDSIPRFFHLWLESAAIPQIHIKQQNDSILFIKNSNHLPVDFQIITKDSTYNISRKDNFKLSDYKQIKTLIVNPGNKELFDIRFDRKKDWIKFQILYAPRFIDKYIALNDLKNWNRQEKDSIYQILIQQDNYYPVYTEILKDITRNPDKIHIEFISKLFQKDLNTRRQIAIYLWKIPLELKENYKSLLKDSSYVTRQVALWHYWDNFPPEQQKILDETKGLPAGNDKIFRMTWLSLSLLTQKYHINEKPKYLTELIDYAAPRFNMQIRLNAFDLIDNLQIITPQSVDYVIDAAFHFNWRLHKPARDLIMKWFKIPEHKNVILQQINKLSSSEKEFLLKMLNKTQ